MLSLSSSESDPERPSPPVFLPCTPFPMRFGRTFGTGPFPTLLAPFEIGGGPFSCGRRYPCKGGAEHPVAPSYEELVELARTCRNQAVATQNRETAAELRRMADEYQRRANALKSAED